MKLGEKIQILKDKITAEEILEIMEEFKVPHLASSINDNEVKFLTVCHGGDSYKLYFYKDTKSFYCYTHCGSLDIINIIQSILNCTLQDAYNFICKRIGLNTIEFQYGFGHVNSENQNETIINKFKPKKKNITKWVDFNIIDEKIFNMFYPFYHASFYNDGISISIMKKFEIQFDLYNNRIIIPHRNIDGSLIAVRCRNLNPDLVNNGKKYMPIVFDNKILSAPTNQYFYGLFQNLENIKKVKRVIIVESEKAVMQYGTMYPECNIAIALCGSNLSDYQIKLLKDLGIREVIIALDKEFELNNSIEEKSYAIKIDKVFVKRLNIFDISIIWDYKNLLKLKDSPTDRGKEIFEELFKFKFSKQDWGIWLDGIYNTRK